jgi:hypothetical protein
MLHPNTYVQIFSLALYVRGSSILYISLDIIIQIFPSIILIVKFVVILRHTTDIGPQYLYYCDIQVDAE